MLYITSCRYPPQWVDRRPVPVNVAPLMKPRVLFLSPVPDFKGGAERSLWDLVANPQIEPLLVVPAEGALSTRTARAVRLLIDRHARRAYVVIGLTPQSSSARESHPRALSDPDVNLSAHPAPIVQPQAVPPSANA